MRQQTFENYHSALWAALEGWIKGEGTLNDEEVPSAYRQLCHHIALCQSRRYSVVLQDRLQRVALIIHQRLYREKTDRRGLWSVVSRDFPRLVRSEWRIVMVAAVLLLGSWGLIFWIVRRQPNFVYLVLTPQQALDYAQMYDPAVQSSAVEWGAMRDVRMFGHYIWNNIGIDFQIFASGLILGVAPFFALFLNGLHGGAVMAHLCNLGLREPIYGFISGHSSFEMVGLIISGSAGIRLGLAWIHPGREGRLASLRSAARRGALLVMGAAGLTFLAAILEGFWSANSWATWKQKVAVGMAFWILLTLYFLLAGRERNAK